MALAVGAALLAPALILTVLLGQRLLPLSSVDGFPVGEPINCGTDGSRCDELVRLARAALDAREPGHPDIVNEALFLESPDHNRSGGVYIAVFTLADGSRHATGVLCAGIDSCRGVEQYPG